MRSTRFGVRPCELVEMRMSHGQCVRVGSPVKKCKAYFIVEYCLIYSITTYIESIQMLLMLARFTAADASYNLQLYLYNVLVQRTSASKTSCRALSSGLFFGIEILYLKVICEEAFGDLSTCQMVYN